MMREGKIGGLLLAHRRIMHCFVFVVMFLLSTSVFAAESEAIVGLLSTRRSTYKGEYKTAQITKDLLLKLGAKKVVLIDYNAIMEHLGNDASVWAVSDYLEKFVSSNGINRIYIPGNDYNISSPPYPPTHYRQMVTNAVVRVMERIGNLKLLAICGGLQGILHAQNVDIKRMDDMLSSSEMAEAHISSLYHPREYGASLHAIYAVPGSRLAAIIEKIRGESKGRALKFYVPDMHSEAVEMSESNYRLLHELGYTISAISDDWIIEGVEDHRGNMLLQMHPDHLLADMEKKMGKNPEVDISIEISKSIIEDFLSN